MRFAKCISGFKVFKSGEAVAFELQYNGRKIMVDIFSPSDGAYHGPIYVMAVTPEVFAANFAEFDPLKINKFEDYDMA